MRVHVVNRQTVVPLNVPAMRRLASHLANRLADSANRRWGALDIIVTDDSGCLTVKRRCFGMEVTTDVVAASYGPIPGEPRGGWTADVVINAERAVCVARRSRTWSPAWELALYLAHGIDHLCGGRDNTDRRRQTMRRRELRWLADAAGRGLIAPILRRATGARISGATRKRK